MNGNLKFSESDRLKIVDLSHKTLMEEDSDDTNEARDYLLNKRKLNEDVLRAFKFGYAPKRSRINGFDWSGRIIMPLFDQHEHIAALTSRDFRVTAKTGMPHLHESFNKRRFLYGLNVAKQSILKKNSAIIVEGQFDTAIMHAHGIKTSVGILGSAFTFEHMALLRRYCQNFYLLFDNDDSGMKNLMRTVSLYDSERMEIFDTFVYPVFFDKQYKDIDELIKSEGVESAKKALIEAKNNHYSNMQKVRHWIQEAKK